MEGSEKGSFSGGKSPIKDREGDTSNKGGSCSTDLAWEKQEKGGRS